jgi:two-component system, OmpR family, alkaline phosphatase synthesis response regulator PhoP
MPKATILVVEDEADIRLIETHALTREGYRCLEADSGEKALDLLRSEAIDLVVLDVMLPGIDGFEVLRRARQDKRLAEIPVILATARSEDIDVVMGLELGADDYLAKPFSPRVLSARVGARLRKQLGAASPQENSQGALSSGGIELDSTRHEVSLDGKPVELSATEFSLLEHLMRHPGWVFSRAQLINAVRGADYPVTDRAVDVQVLGLRKKLGDKGDLVQTVRGVGYRFKDDKEGPA